MKHTQEYINSQVVFDGNDVDVLYNYLTENEFNYAKTQLVKDFPELRALKYDPHKTLLDQISEVKGIKPEVLHKRVGLESLYSLLINKHYELVVKDLNDPKFSLWKKAKITGMPVENIMADRTLKVIFWMLVMGIGFPCLVAFLLSWWNVFLIVVVGFYLRLSHNKGLAVLQRRYREMITNIVTRGD